MGDIHLAFSRRKGICSDPFEGSRLNFIFAHGCFLFASVFVFSLPIKDIFPADDCTETTHFYGGASDRSDFNLMKFLLIPAVLEGIKFFLNPDRV